MVGIKVNPKEWKRKSWDNVVSIDITYRDRERTWPLVHIWRRTKSGKSKIEDKDSFPSYFYIPKSEENTLKTSNANPDTIEYPKIKSMDGEELIKLNYQKFSWDQIRGMRDIFKKTYEDDVKYNLRYLLDNDIKFSTDRRICFFDIENDMSLDIVNTPKKILSIATYDNYSKNLFCFVLDPKIKCRVKKEERGENSYVLRYKEEKAMLMDFISYIKLYDFDIITAYNLNAFDWPYLINRMKKVGITYRDLSETGNCYVFVNEDDPTMNRIYCGGRELIDYYILIKKYYDEDKPEDYKLDTVAEKILNIKKIDYPYDHVGELYREDIELFIDYNIQDVIIIKDLDEKVKFISAYLISLQQLIPMPLQPIIDNSVALDFYILKTYNGKVVFPSKIKKERVKFEGAITGKLVIESNGEVVSVPPEKKMFSNIAVFDFSALYPNIFKTFNISPETITIPGDSDSITIEDVAFMQGRQGLLPGLVDGIIKLRKKYQDELETMSPNNPNYIIYHNIQYAIKRVNNCFSGDTEILTREGIKNIKDINIGDEVYSINPNTLNLEIKKVKFKFKEKAPKEMYHFKSSHCDLLVTGDHRMLIRRNNNRENNIRFIKARDFKSNDNIPMHRKMNLDIKDENINLASLINLNNYEIVIKSKEQQRITMKFLKRLNIKYKRHNHRHLRVFCNVDEIEMLYDYGYDIYLKNKRSKNCSFSKPIVNRKIFSSFMGWYISEGSYYKSIRKVYNDTVRGEYDKISISQEESVYSEWIYEILKNLGVKINITKKGFSFCSGLYMELCSQCGKSYSKNIPDFIYNELDKKEFFSSLYLGDGTSKRGLYSTVSKRLRDQVLMLSLELGYVCRCRNEILKNGNVIYRITLTKQKNIYFKSGVKKIPFNEDYVYCITVEDNHTVYAGRNGKFLWCGQSLYGACSFPGFRLFDIRVAKAITKIGQKMIKESFKYTSQELNYNVIYSDTDSIFVELKCDVNDKEKTVEEINYIEKEVNKHIEDVVLEMGSQKNYLVMDAEKRFKKLIFLGVKKIYLGTADYWKGKFLDKNKYVIKGFALVRREMPDPIKNIVRKIIYSFLDGKNYLEIKPFYQEGARTLRNMSPHQLAWTKGINKNISEYIKMTPQHIKATMLSKKELGIDFYKGDYPKLIYIKPAIKIPHTFKDMILSCDCIAFKRDTIIPDKILSMIDYDRVLDSFLNKKLEMFFGVEGLEMEKVIQDENNLLSYFNNNVSTDMIDRIKSEEGI
jgi:DNA polymerase, archaea type